MDDRFITVFQPGDIHRSSFGHALDALERSLGLDSAMIDVLFEIFHYLDAVGVWCDFSAESLRKDFRRLVGRTPLWTSRDVNLEEALEQLVSKSGLVSFRSGWYAVSDKAKQILYPYCFGAPVQDNDASLMGMVPGNVILSEDNTDDQESLSVPRSDMFLAITGESSEGQRTRNRRDLPPVQCERGKQTVSHLDLANLVPMWCMGQPELRRYRACSTKRRPLLRTSE